MTTTTGAQEVARDLKQGIALIERANARLDVSAATRHEAQDLMRAYARVQKLGGYGIAALSPAVGDAASVARAAGTTMAKARDAAATGMTLQSSPVLGRALRKGDVSLDQATEIARAEDSCPGAAAELLKVARTKPFQALRDEARRVKLEAEQHRDLAARQRAARKARSYCDRLGMVHIHLELEPHVGAGIVSRAETEAQRLARAAHGPEREAFERVLADAYAAMLSEAGPKGRSSRPEVTVLVSHGVATRGWKDVRDGEVCKIPGIGPVAPEVARAIANDAFLNGVFFDGVDLRHFKRWTRGIPAPVRAALELGEPPGFDGIRCVDCGRHFRTQWDHDEPRASGGPTSKPNLKPRCPHCHPAKTRRDREAGKLHPRQPGGT